MPLDTNIFRHGKETSPVLTAFYKNTLSMFGKMIYFIVLYFTIEIFSIKDTFWIVILVLFSLILTNIIYLN